MKFESTDFNSLIKMLIFLSESYTIIALSFRCCVVWVSNPVQMITCPVITAGCFSWVKPPERKTNPSSVYSVEVRSARDFT